MLCHKLLHYFLSLVLHDMYLRSYAQNPSSTADLPTRSYLPVLVRKSAGSTEVRLYFSKYGHRVSRKYGNHDVNDASLLPAKPIVDR